MANIRCIIGLANPGSEYANTRHNAGAWFIQALLSKYGGQLSLDTKRKAHVGRLDIPGSDCRVAIPTDFMNLSGDSVQLLSHYFKVPPDELLIAHDELDLEPGVVRLKNGGGHGGHNGLRDTIQKLSTPNFARLRIGIGHPGHKNKVTGYVLKAPSADDKIEIDSAIDRMVSLTPDLLSGEWDRVQTALHTTTR